MTTKAKTAQTTNLPPQTTQNAQKSRRSVNKNAITSSGLGSKRYCLKCGAPFYDLNRNPIRCIRCDATFTPESYRKARYATDRSGRAVAPPPPENDPLDEDDDTDNVDVESGLALDDDA